MTSSEINPTQTQLQESKIPVTNWNTVATDSSAAHYSTTYSFEDESAVGYLFKTDTKSKGDN